MVSFGPRPLYCIVAFHLIPGGVIFMQGSIKLCVVFNGIRFFYWTAIDRIRGSSGHLVILTARQK
jgi:hypothetical protein